MRVPALGQARTSCVYLLHTTLNFSSLPKGFTERTLPKRLSLADDSIFSPISSSLMSPPNKILPKKHLALDFPPLSQKNELFSSPEGLALLLYPIAAADTTWRILPQISQFTSRVYTGVTGRKERTPSEKSPVLKGNSRVSLNSGWNSTKNSEIGSPLVTSF